MCVWREWRAWGLRWTITAIYWDCVAIVENRKHLLMHLFIYLFIVMNSFMSHTSITFKIFSIHLKENVDNLRILTLNVLNLRDTFHLVDQIVVIIRFLRPVSDWISKGTWMNHSWPAGGRHQNLQESTALIGFVSTFKLDYLRQGAGYSRRLFACLLVCMSFSKITQKVIWFYLNF